MRPVIVLALALTAAGCVAPRQPAPPPARPAPAPIAPAPAPTQLPVPTDWRDLPLTPGAWRYVPTPGGGTASFGPGGGPALFSMRCDRATRTVVLLRHGIAGPELKLTTSYAAAHWPAGAGPDGAAVSLRATDKFLDRIAFSRGRFTVEVPGAERLVIPAWAEPARAIEDCRG